VRSHPGAVAGRQPFRPGLFDSRGRRENQIALLAPAPGVEGSVRLHDELPEGAGRRSGSERRPSNANGAERHSREDPDRLSGQCW
jgi:hypothetical protein